MAIVFAAIGSAAIFWAAFCSVPRIQWNPPRLAPAFALAEGLDFYATSASGAQLGWCYGPIFPIFSLPATLASNLTAAFWIWSGLNLLAICVPAWLILREALGACVRAWIGLPLYSVLLLANPTTGSMLHFIHVDALCVGFGLMAALCLYRATRDGKNFLHGVALSVALAIFTKQLAISLIPAFLCWLWWWGRQELIRPLIFWLAIYCGGLCGVFFLWFGDENLIFNLVLYQACMPRTGDFMQVVREMLRMFSTAWVWIAIVALKCLCFRSARGKSPLPTLENLILWVAVFHLPLGLWILTKEGGGLNSMHSINFFLPVVTIWLMDVAAFRPSTDGPWWQMPSGLIVLIVVLLALGNVCRLEFEDDRPLWKPDRGQEKMLQAARENLGRVYFPWNPLVTIISDKKIYPFDDALRWLYAAGLSPTPEAIRAAVPLHPLIIYLDPVQSKFALNYFQNFHAAGAEERLRIQLHDRP